MRTPVKHYKVLLLLSIAVLSAISVDNRQRISVMDSGSNQRNAMLNIRVRQYVAHYIRENEEELNAVRQRSAGPFRIIDSVFTKFGLPKEMKYLAVIESQLRSNALSRAGARGAWQLMPATAQLLGLKVDSIQDERTHFSRSTVAAAKYLKDLHREFSDWLLVLAAYNGGPGPVYRAIRKSGSHDYWNLEKYLPAESRGHVRRFIASHYYFEGLASVAQLTKGQCLDCVATL